MKQVHKMHNLHQLFKYIFTVAYIKYTHIQQYNTQKIASLIYY